MTTFAKNCDDGASAVEYSLLVALIAGLIGGVVGLIGADLLAIFTNATTWF